MEKISIGIFKVKLINLGRNNINKICEIDSTKGLVNDSLEDTLAEVAKHYLLSSDIDVQFNKETEKYSVYAGFNKVGEMEILKQPL